VDNIIHYTMQHEIGRLLRRYFGLTTLFTYHPFHKEKNETNYVHVHSNHPSNIIKQIPISIQARLLNLSLSEEVFSASITFYGWVL